MDINEATEEQLLEQLQSVRTVLGREVRVKLHESYDEPMVGIQVFDNGDREEDLALSPGNTRKLISRLQEILDGLE